MSLIYKQKEDLKEVLSVVKAFHGEIKHKTILMMNLDLYDPDIQAILSELDLPVAEKPKGYSEVHDYFIEFEEGFYDEINILVELSKDPIRNPYAPWRICDLYSPQIMNIYLKTICKNINFEKQFEDFNDFYSFCIPIFFKAIEDSNADFLKWIKKDIYFELSHLLLNNNPKSKTTVWYMVYKVMKISNDYILKNNKEPSVSYLCEKTGYSEERVKKYLSLANMEMCSFDDSIKVESEESQKELEDMVLKKDVADAINNIKNETKRAIVLNAFGFVENPLGVTEMMKEYGLSYKQYRLLYDQAINQLRISLDGYQSEL